MFKIDAKAIRLSNQSSSKNINALRCKQFSEKKKVKLVFRKYIKKRKNSKKQGALFIKNLFRKQKRIEKNFFVLKKALWRIGSDVAQQSGT